MSAPVDDFEDTYEEEYVEIDTTRDIGGKSKIVVKSFVLTEFGDVKEALDAIREGYTIALINIKQLKDRDIVELSNLQRQTLFNEEDINKSKAFTAKKHLDKINSQIKPKYQYELHIIWEIG
mgnify:CR=1 FL=1